MPTNLHWLDGPWPGKLALAARPRGGDWIEDEMAAWRRAGVDAVVSLLTPEEVHDLDLAKEASEVARLGMEFISFPIPDREVPTPDATLGMTLERVDSALSSGKNVAVHCRQGVGRAGLIAACLLISKGWTPEVAVERLGAARGVSVPETAEQRLWIDRYAAISTTAT